MIFKKKAFNVIIAMLVFLIGISFIFGSSASASAGEGDGPTPGITEPGDIGGNELPVAGVPSIKKPLALLKYSIDLMENGKGYKSRNYQEAITQVMGISVVQKVVTYRESNKSGYLETSFADGGSLGENFYRHFYTDITSGNMEFFRTDDYNYANETVNFASSNVQNLDLETTKQTYNTLPNKFHFDIQSNSVKILSAKTSDSGKYYIITFDFSKDKISDSYKSMFAQSSDLVVNGSIKFTTDIRITMYINAATGKLMQYNKSEEYYVDLTIMNLKNVKMTAVSSEAYTQMDSEFTIYNPIG